MCSIVTPASAASAPHDLANDLAASSRTEGSRICGSRWHGDTGSSRPHSRRRAMSMAAWIRVNPANIELTAQQLFRRRAYAVAEADGSGEGGPARRWTAGQGLACIEGQAQRRSELGG